MKTIRRSSVFVASSVAGLDFARAIQLELERDFTVKLWYQGVFQPSESTIEGLLIASMSFDFGIFVFSPDDSLEKNGTKYLVARDNVLFECGLFFSTIGRRCCFFLVPENVEKFHLPTDLWGITPAGYQYQEDVQAAMGGACTKIRNAIQRMTKEATRGLSLDGDWDLEWSVPKSQYYKAPSHSLTSVSQVGSRFRAVCIDRVVPFEVTGELRDNRYITGTWHQTAANYHGSFQIVLTPTGDEMNGMSVGFKSNGQVLPGVWKWTKILS